MAWDKVSAIQERNASIERPMILIPQLFLQSRQEGEGSQQAEIRIFAPFSQNSSRHHQPMRRCTSHRAGDLNSATATTLLSLALVLLDGCFVVTQTLEVSEDSRFRHLTLEPAQSRFNAFVFADRDLSHATSRDFKLTNLASGLKASPQPLRLG